jgi:hypothetical protein
MTEFVSWLNKDGSSNIVLHLGVLGLMVSWSFLQWHLILIALGEMPMHLEGILPGRISHSSLEQEISCKRVQIFM